MYVALDARLTADVLIPPRPAFACTDSQGRATICNGALADWTIQYDGQLKQCRGQLREIRNLQPKESNP